MHLLLPLDTDEKRAIEAANAVKTIPNANDTVRVTILNVQPKVKISDGDGRHVSSEEWYDEKNFPDSVPKVVELLEDAGIEYNKHREHGEPAEEILSVAEELGVDWIIMCGRKRTPVGKVLFGSVTQSVMLNANVPVTVVPSELD